jgi:uncharacterized repeat protein (TIGR03803 family)
MPLASFSKPHALRPCAYIGSYFSPEVIEMKRKEFFSSSAWLLAIFVCILMFVGSAMAAGSAEKVLYRFKGGSDGYAPFAGLIADKVGNLYGTTADGGAGCQGGCGTVFELSPASGGRWTETVLHRFTGGSDGAVPESGLIFDTAGNLYGTTIHGGASGDGTIFQLMAPARSGRAWTLNVLHSFIGHTDGKLSMGTLTFNIVAWVTAIAMIALTLVLTYTALFQQSVPPPP